ncbi:unnamed protein product [Sphagnum jensenii]
MSRTCLLLQCVFLESCNLPTSATRSLLSNSFTCPQAFFIFGDSLTDTGNIQILAPGVNSTTLNYPYGESYTFTNERGHNRYSDGRLIVDFIAQAFGFPFFEPILLQSDKGFQTDYTHGVNFAYSGATVIPNNTKNPIYLQYELDKFFDYKKALLSSPQPSTPLSFLPTAAYLIPEMGINDFYYAYSNGVSPETAIDEILPKSLKLVVSAVEQLHASGARIIIVGNQQPQGCSPSVLTPLRGIRTGRYDTIGCSDEHNRVNRVFNRKLKRALTKLQESYKIDGTLIIQFDFYNAFMEVFTNPAKYGFNPSNRFEVCCGFGGPYNYNGKVMCGNNGTVPLSKGRTQFVNISTALNPKEHIEWDGVHFTEATYKVIASFFLSDLPTSATRSLLSNSFPCPQAFFIFGDSITDTGNIQLLAPGLAATTLNYPYGESYTFTNERGHNRYSDGRLIVDFIAQAFGFPFFEPILLELEKGFKTDYTHGVDFAYSGAVVLPNSTVTPIHLQVELDQFFVYKKALLSSPQPSTPLSFLPTAAYLIPEIGINDFTNAYVEGASPQTVIDEILPKSLNVVVSVVKQLHASGARTIIVGNQPPQGCSSSILTAFLGTGPYDTIGCLDKYNKVNKVFNKKLKQALTKLQESYKTDGTLIIQFDFYNALTELYTNPAQYGFNPSTKLEACCGFGGPYNYNRNVTCGDSGNVSLSTGGTQFVNISTAPNPKEHIEWDGIHFTQAAYKIIASFFLSGHFFISPLGFNFKHLCNLDFSQF